MATCCSASTATAASCGSTNDLRVTTLVDKFEGKRLNAPNDLVFRSDGTLFFTDPPYGLPRQDDDPEKDIPFNGVFKLSDGKVDVIIKDLTRPNGIAFSPDEKTLYVSNSDEQAAHLDAVRRRGSLEPSATAASSSMRRLTKTAACPME